MTKENSCATSLLTAYALHMQPDLAVRRYPPSKIHSYSDVPPCRSTVDILEPGLFVPEVWHPRESPLMQHELAVRPCRCIGCPVLLLRGSALGPHSSYGDAIVGTSSVYSTSSSTLLMQRRLAVPRSPSSERRSEPGKSLHHHTIVLSSRETRVRLTELAASCRAIVWDHTTRYATSASRTTACSNEY